MVLEGEGVADLLVERVSVPVLVDDGDGVFDFVVERVTVLVFV